MNDNLPELTLPLIISPIPETLVVVLSISDLDPGDNGRITCSTEREATLAPEILCRKILYCNVRRSTGPRAAGQIQLYHHSDRPGQPHAENVAHHHGAGV